MDKERSLATLRPSIMHHFEQQTATMVSNPVLVASSSAHKNMYLMLRLFTSLWNIRIYYVQTYNDETF